MVVVVLVVVVLVVVVLRSSYMVMSPQQSLMSHRTDLFRLRFSLLRNRESIRFTFSSSRWHCRSFYEAVFEQSFVAKDFE